MHVKMAKKLLKMYPKYSKMAFDIITGNETWVYYFEPKRKVVNRIWATKNARRSSTAERIQTVKSVLYAIFFTNKGPAIQILVRKGRTVTSQFYKNVVLRKLKNYYKVPTLKQDLSMSYFCMIMHPITRHVL